jgi:hypothetical protein
MRIRGWLFRKRHGALIDALRSSTELFDTTTEYGREEVNYIVAVNRRLIRHYDPDGTTDRRVR